MTNDPNFDRIARAWLETGQGEAPDRVIAAVLKATETTRQVQRRISWPFRLTPPIPRPVVVTTMLATLVIVIGAQILLTRSDDQVAAPSVMPSSSPAQAAPPAVPDALRMVSADGSFPPLAVWLSGPRSLPGQAPASGTGLRFTETTVAVAQSNQMSDPLIVTSGSGTADGSLQLTTSASCPTAAVGEYAWSLSADGRRLTIAAVSDGCAIRLGALPGEWHRVACKDPTQPCLGDLAPGTYPSVSIAPRLKGIDRWVPEYGAVTYTVPDGWANAADWSNELVLVPSSEYATYGPSGTVDGTSHRIVVAASPVLTDQTADCKGKEAALVDRSVEGFIDWLRAQPSILSSEPTPITVGGSAGQWIDVEVAPTWTATCPDDPSGIPTAVILNPRAGAVPTTSGGNATSWRLVGKERMRLVFVDIGQGDIALICVDATDPTRFETLANEAMPIIESMTFQ